MKLGLDSSLFSVRVPIYLLNMGLQIIFIIAIIFIVVDMRNLLIIVVVEVPVVLCNEGGNLMCWLSVTHEIASNLCRWTNVRVFFTALSNQCGPTLPGEVHDRSNSLKLAQVFLY